MPEAFERGCLRRSALPAPRGFPGRCAPPKRRAGRVVRSAGREAGHARGGGRHARDLGQRAVRGDAVAGDTPGGRDVARADGVQVLSVAREAQVARRGLEGHGAEGGQRAVGIDVEAGDASGRVAGVGELAVRGRGEPARGAEPDGQRRGDRPQTAPVVEPVGGHTARAGLGDEHVTAMAEGKAERHRAVGGVITGAPGRPAESSGSVSRRLDRRSVTTSAEPSGATETSAAPSAPGSSREPPATIVSVPSSPAANAVTFGVAPELRTYTRPERSATLSGATPCEATEPTFSRPSRVTRNVVIVFEPALAAYT